MFWEPLSSPHGTKRQILLSVTMFIYLPLSMVSNSNVDCLVSIANTQHIQKYTNIVRFYSFWKSKKKNRNISMFAMRQRYIRPLALNMCAYHICTNILSDRLFRKHLNAVDVRRSICFRIGHPSFHAIPRNHNPIICAQSLRWTIDLTI